MAEEGDAGVDGHEEGEVEFREISGWRGWEGCAEVGEYDKAGDLRRAGFGRDQKGRGAEGGIVRLCVDWYVRMIAGIDAGLNGYASHE